MNKYEELKFLGYSLAGQENSWSERSRTAKQETQGPIWNASKKQMDRRRLRSFNDPELRGQREKRLETFYRRHGDKLHSGQRPFEWLFKEPAQPGDEQWEPRGLDEGLGRWPACRRSTRGLLDRAVSKRAVRFSASSYCSWW